MNDCEIYEHGLHPLKSTVERECVTHGRRVPIESQQCDLGTWKQRALSAEAVVEAVRTVCAERVISAEYGRDAELVSAVTLEDVYAALDRDDDA